MTTSYAIIVPDAHRNAFNMFFVAFGDDELPGFYVSVPLSSNGEEPATHWGCRTDLTATRVEQVQEWKNGVLPTPLANFDWGTLGVTSDDVIAAGQSMIIGIGSPGQNDRDLFLETVANAGLMEIVDSVR